jgi:hypothetical protein
VVLPKSNHRKGVKKLVYILFPSFRWKPESSIFKPLIPPQAGLDPGFHRGDDGKQFFHSF